VSRNCEAASATLQSTAQKSLDEPRKRSKRASKTQSSRPFMTDTPRLLPVWLAAWISGLSRSYWGSVRAIPTSASLPHFHIPAVTINGQPTGKDNIKRCYIPPIWWRASTLSTAWRLPKNDMNGWYSYTDPSSVFLDCRHARFMELNQLIRDERRASRQLRWSDYNY